MKKFLKILFCLILIFSLAAKNEAKAEGGIKNIHIDSNGMVTWDPYPGAYYYAVCADVFDMGPKDWVDVGKPEYINATSYDLQEHLKIISAGTRSYSVRVEVYNERHQLVDTGQSEDTYDYAALGVMGSPKLPDWKDFTIATWNGVSGADRYHLTIYRDGFPYDDVYVYDHTYTDLEWWMTGTNHQYSFSVTAMAYGYGESISSGRSPEVAGMGRAIMRVSGSSRYETSMDIATAVRNILHEYQNFDTVFVATGSNYPDALSGAFLANNLGAPLLMINEKKAKDVVSYINGNLNPGGTVYVLGGDGVVKNEWLNGLGSSYHVQRLSGKDRYGTNLAILDEYLNKVNSAFHVFLVCTGKGFADALSCSAMSYPMLLVGNSLNADQKAWLSGLEKDNTYFYIIGGEGAVSMDVENTLGNYGRVMDRVSGKNRYETSALIADYFNPYQQRAVFATGKNFPDGLSGGPLAYALEAPLLLIDDGKTSDAFVYCDYPGIRVAYIAGGTGAVSDAAACAAIGVDSLE